MNGLPGTPVPDSPGDPGPGPGAGGSLGRRRAKKDREEERPARAGGPVPAPLRPASAYNAPAITPTRFDVGALVEANSEGAGEWHAAAVTAVNDDGTYDVQYDEDGEEEEAMPKFLLRARRTGAGGGRWRDAKEKAAEQRSAACAVS